MPDSQNKNQIINRAFMRLVRRSERADPSHLVDTFVDIGPLFTLLSSDDHQIVFGRRGTGKTHAFNFLSESKTDDGDIVIFLDLSNIGSSGGIYANHELPLAERATRLLNDTLLAIHERLYEVFLEHSEELNLSIAGPLLDDLADAARKVHVIGETTQNADVESATATKEQTTLGLKSSDGLSAASDSSFTANHRSTASVRRSGLERHSVHFGSIRGIWGRLAKILAPRKTWLLLDEWSSVPLDLQPLLTDFFRRSFFSVRSVVVKIAAIEQRSRFATTSSEGSYQGIEVGADAAADINLDDFMVFDNDSEAARQFYTTLLFKHVSTTDIIEQSGVTLESEAEFLRVSFTQVNTFDELVRASEGVPRDAINIAIQAAQYAGANPISMDHVRRAAHAWYQRDKEAAIKATVGAPELLHWIINEVIGDRRARAFLLRTDNREPLIESLFDARILHILKKNVSTHDDPGIRYHVYKLDFGCYVDLMSTARAPQGLLVLDRVEEALEDKFVHVPPDDYRAIRRAILQLKDFYENNGSVRNSVSIL